MHERLTPADIDFGAGSQRLVLVLDSLHCDAHFVVLACVQRLLKAGHKVVLAHARWPERHYQTVLRKLGVAPSSAQAQGLLSFVDLLSAVPQDTLQAAGVQVPPDALRRVYWALLDALDAAAGSHESSDGGDKASLVIDALSEMYTLAESPLEWRAFVMQLMHLPALYKDRVSLVILAHSDAPDDSLWLRMLQHAAQVTWEAEPLSFAHAASFSGRLSGLWRAGRPLEPRHGSAPRHLTADDMRQVFNFRLRDGSVELGKLGSAGAGLTL